MKIPEKVKVAGHEYKIVFDDKYLSDNDLLGEISHKRLIISICESQKGVKLSQSVIEENLLHEILHAIDCNYNNHSLNEQDITNMAVGLYQVLKDNFNF